MMSTLKTEYEPVGAWRLEDSESINTDPILLRLLSLSQDWQRQEAIGRLVQEQVKPVAQAVIGRLLNVSFSSGGHEYEDQEAEDICSQVVSLILKRISLFLSAPEEFPIQKIEWLTSIIARRACADYLRQRYPERSRLRDQLRYLLQTQESFAFWKAKNGDWRCGYLAWQGRETSSRTKKRLEKWGHDPRVLSTVGLELGEVHRGSLVRLVAAIFNLTGEPVVFNDLVKLIALWRGLGKQADQLGEEHMTVTRGSHCESVPDVESRLFLHSLWQEIEMLPISQRCALLLNLRYEGERGLLTTLVLLPVTSFEKVAQALGRTTEQLVAILKTLPWDDQQIAEFLGVTRQQVINLRRSARRTLTSRLEGKS